MPGGLRLARFPFGEDKLQKPLAEHLADTTMYPIKRTWDLTPAEGTTVENLLNPEFWSHIAAKLQPDDQIWVTPADRNFVAHLLVVDCTNLSARMQVLSHHEIDPVSAHEDDRYEVKWGGPKHKWRVLRKSDAAVVEHGFASRGAAYKHINTLAV